MTPFPHANIPLPLTPDATTVTSVRYPLSTPAGSTTFHFPPPPRSYETVRVVGNGSFGVVFQATCIETGDTVAIKKVLQGRDIVHCHVTT